MRFVPTLAFLLSCIVLTPAAAGTLRPDLSDLGTLPLHQLSAPIVSKAIATVESKTAPYQFAVPMDLPLTLADGQWQQLGDVSRWRTRIQSAGAQTLNFAFSTFHLPPDASLWIYDSAGELVQGPFTQADENAEGTLWTPVIAGGDAIIELQVPTRERDAVQLQLGKVNHGFRGFAKDSGIPSKAGSCEVDAVCPAGDAWRNEIRAVARISINGNTLCSGQLLNNVRQDDTPYFLTAHHCGIANGSVAASVVFYWNYQSSSCGGPRDGGISQTQSGSSFVSDNTSSDYTLLKLNATPNSAYNVYLAGWNANGLASAPGAVIHHPNGDEKSISLFNSSGSATTINLCAGVINAAGLCLLSPGGPVIGTTTINVWKIAYSQGVTEPGSSGSGLWDTNHRIVGQLSGGDSSCSAPTASDYYGRFDRSFVANSFALKNTLDPDNTSIVSLCGKDPGAGACQTKSGDSTGISIKGTAGALAPSSSSGSGGGAINPSMLVLLLMGWFCRRYQRPS